MTHRFGFSGRTGVVVVRTTGSADARSGKTAPRLLISVIFTMVLFCSPLCHASYGGGSGTAEDPYLIYTPQHLRAIAGTPYDWDKHFRLMADIDLTDFPSQMSDLIGRYPQDGNDTPFMGVFDGNGKTISHFSYTSEGTGSVGLFGYIVAPAQIKGLTLEDPDVEVSGGSQRCVGTLVGFSRWATITNCHVRGGSVSGSAGNDWPLIGGVGGLIGENQGTIRGCTVEEVSVAGRDFAGGLAGSNVQRGSITGCSIKATVSGTNDTGGVAGAALYDANMVDCSAVVTVVGATRVGGLVGNCEFAKISRSFSSGSVTGSSEVGGLIGHNRAGVLADSYAMTAVTGASAVGGLVGYNGPSCGCSIYTPSVVSHCYATGGVQGAADAGGLLGMNVRAIIGDSFWDRQTSGTSKMCGFEEIYGRGCDDGCGKTTAEMKTAGTFLTAGWDFILETANGTQDPWCICAGHDYPTLTWRFVPGDLDGDGDVDLMDLARLAIVWRGPAAGFWCGSGGADLTNDGVADIADLTAVAQYWLSGLE